MHEGLECYGAYNPNNLIFNSAVQYLGDSDLTPITPWGLDV